MPDMILVEPFQLNLSTIGLGPPMNNTPAIYVQDSGGLGTGTANLVTNDPREVWSSNSGGTTFNLWVDLGKDMQWDTIALINTSFLPTATFLVDDGTQAQNSYYANLLVSGFVARVPSEDVADANGPVVFVSATVRNSRYLTMNVTQPAGSPNFSIGRLIVGKSFRPSIWQETGGSFEQGAGRPMIDSGSRERLSDGGLATVSGRLISGFQWVYGDLDSPDLAKLWGMFRRLRTTEPLLLVEGYGATVAEGVHYCTFASLEKYDRSQVNKSRWVFAVEDWL